MTTPETQETPAGPETPAAAPDPAPWGDEENFDADKAKKLIANLRGENTKLKNRPVLDDDAKAKLAEYDKLTEAAKTAEEKAREEAARWQTEAETWRGTAVAARIQALAAPDFADPTDAVNGLAATNYLDAGGVIDEAAIQADLAKLLEAKPHYRRPADTTPRAPAPNQSQGKSGAAATDPASQFGAILQNALR